jgi:hypothetical protein
MGPKLLIDSGGGFHGIWDNSPDKPIDGVNRPVPGEMARYDLIPGQSRIHFPKYSHYYQ